MEINPTCLLLVLFNMASMLFCNINIVGKSRYPGGDTGAGLTGLRNPNNWLDLLAIKAKIGLGLTTLALACAFIINGWVSKGDLFWAKAAVNKPLMFGNDQGFLSPETPETGGTSGGLHAESGLRIDWDV